MIGNGSSTNGRSIALEIDGYHLRVPAGSTILEACRSAGIEVPTLCFDPRLAPYGSCRICLVGVEGARWPMAACVTPAADGMRVDTRAPDAVGAARRVLRLIVSQLPERALDLPEQRSELVRVCERLGVAAPDFGTAYESRGFDFSHPYVKLDRDLCIACARCVRMCDEVQGTFALTLASRGYSTMVVPGTGAPWNQSDCVACGGCVSSCPTGALSEPGLLDLRPTEPAVTTTCGYCGVGCSLDVHVRDGQVASITPTLEGATINRGHTCVKGRFAHGFVRAGDRLTRPLIRRGDHLEETTWGEAVGHVAAELHRIVDSYGSDAVAGIASSRATNEENYLFQKFLRAGIGTHNVDNCARLCHAPSAAGLVASLGHAGATNPFDDVDRSDCILLAGSNATEGHPVAGARIKQRVLAGARLIVVDPRRIELAEYADVHLMARAGTNVAVFNGLAHVLLADGYADAAYLDQRVDGLEDLRAVLASYTPEAVEEISGVPAADLRRAAALYGEARYATICYGLGITEHAHGTDGVRTLANLALLTGRIGTERGGGVNPLRGQNNVQGASDMGALPDLLPGYQKLADDAAVARFEQAWGVELKRQRGLRIPEMFDAAIEGGVKALWVMGEDIRQTDPDVNHVDAALDACELIVSQEIFLSRTAERADVVFPAAAFLEKDGTFVNLDRRFQRVRPALRPPGEARSDFEIVALVAHAMGIDLGLASPAAALEECARLTPTFAGISHERLDREGLLVWPCRSPQDPGERRLYSSAFGTPSGRAQLHAKHYLPPGESADEEYPFTLITGRRLEHYNAGTMTRRTPNAVLVDRELLEVHPDDAERLGVCDGAQVRLTSRRGSIQLTSWVTDRVNRGELFMAFHFPEAAANDLTSGATDEVTGCPEYKVTAVHLAAVAAEPPREPVGAGSGTRGGA
jgi:formate dehydrogenase alpha subunit